MVKSESKSNSDDRSYMSAFEVKSEGSRRGRKYGNLLDGSHDDDSAKDFKRGDQLIKGGKRGKKSSLIPLKSEKRKPAKEKEQDDKSVKSKGSSYSFALSNKSVLSARILKT